MPPEVWMLVEDMRGGRDFWLRQHRTSVLPSVPRTVYRFSFVGVFRAGSAVYTARYNECALRPGLKRLGRGKRPGRGRRPMMKVYEITEMRQVAKTDS